MATPVVIPIFDPSGKVRLIPQAQAQAAIQAGGVIAVRMQDPKGTPRWIRQSDVPTAIQAGGRVLNAPPSSPEILPPDGKGAPRPPQGFTERVLGRKPVSDTLGNVLEHAKNFVAGPYHAFTDPASEQERQDLYDTNPIRLGAYRMFAEPTVNAFREAQKQWRAKNYGIGNKSDYDEQGNYHPSVVSSAMDAIPMVGPWARQIANETVQKGALPALAGAATDIATPAVASKALRAPALIKRGATEVVAPSKVLDAPLPKDTVTPRQRYIDAKNQGVNLDLAQATNARLPGVAKRATEHSLFGGPKFEENNAANVQALHDYTSKMQDSIAPQMSREDFGNLVRDRLNQHKQLLKDQAGHEDYAKAIIDDTSPNPMSREEFGNMAKQKLLEHLDELKLQSGDMFDDLTKRVGKKLPYTKDLKEFAQKIIDDNKDYYANHSELLRGGTKTAWQVLNDLAGNKEIPTGQTAPIPDTWGDLHRLRSDIMDLYRGPEIVGSRAEGWLKQLTAEIDNVMTKGAKSGLNANQRAEFRQANDIYRQMKETYDNPTSKLYHVVRAPDGLTAANMLNDITPQVARQISTAATDLNSPELWNQLQRQTIERLFDPEGNGSLDLDNFGQRFNKAQKEKLGGVVRDIHMEALQDLADKTSEYGPYDHPSSKLYKIVNAKDGTEAADHLSRVTPETARQIAKAASDLGDDTIVPQLQRQTIDRILNPAGNDLPDLQNLSSRFTRAQKDQLGGVLSPEQLDDLEKLARTSKVVNFDSNPSGTAKSMNPTIEAGSIGAGVTGMAAGMLTGSPAEIATSAVPLAVSAGRTGIAKAMTSPGVTESLMGPRPPVPPAKLSPVAVTQEVGAIGQNQSKQETPEEIRVGANATPPAVPKETETREGVSTPPNDGQVLDVDKAEPNDVSGAIAAPEGATHEVLSPDGKTVTGHVVNGQYVPLASEQNSESQQ